MLLLQSIALHAHRQDDRGLVARSRALLAFPSPPSYWRVLVVAAGGVRDSDWTSQMVTAYLTSAFQGRSGTSFR